MNINFLCSGVGGGGGGEGLNPKSSPHPTLSGTKEMLADLCHTGWPPKNGTVDFLGLCSDQQLSFFTLRDRASFPHYNNTKIIKFG